MEATHVSICGGRDNENVLYTYSGIMFRLREKEILTYATTWMNLEDVSVAERQILYDPIYMKC